MVKINLGTVKGPKGDDAKNFAFDVEDGELYLTYEDTENPPKFSLSEDGHLCKEVDGILVDLGLVKGAKGDSGEAGEPGEGVPVGGTKGQILKKVDEEDYNTEWADIETGLSFDNLQNIGTDENLSSSLFLTKTSDNNVKICSGSDILNKSISTIGISNKTTIDGIFARRSEDGKGYLVDKTTIIDFLELGGSSGSSPVMSTTLYPDYSTGVLSSKFYMGKLSPSGDEEYSYYKSKFESLALDGYVGAIWGNIFLTASGCTTFAEYKQTNTITYTNIYFAIIDQSNANQRVMIPLYLEDGTKVTKMSDFSIFNQTNKIRLEIMGSSWFDVKGILHPMI